MSVGEYLLEELECETVFTIPIFGGIEVSEATVVTWIIMAVLILFAFIMTRGLKVHNISKRQAAVELAVTRLTGLCESMLGEEGKRYAPYLTTVLIYIGVANLIGIFGMKAPTKDIRVTIALALMSIVLVQVVGITHKGVGKWALKTISPINLLDLVTRPLSLCMRLFGNVLGAFVIMELLKKVCPIILPGVLSMYFDLFDGLLQAYVFVFLTSIYIKEAIE